LTSSKPFPTKPKDRRRRKEFALCDNYLAFAAGRGYRSGVRHFRLSFFRRYPEGTS
jgi:hypothetical protein